jgi:hypothetical protein
MKVIAIKLAFHNGTLVNVGDEVEVPEGHKGSWFVKADAIEAKAAVKPAKAKAKGETPRALSQTGKEEAKTFIQAHSEKTDLA